VKTPSRRTIAGVVTVGALLAGGGCGAMSTTQVLKPAQLSDGVSASLGTVQAQALVLVGDKGQPGVLTGAFTNSGNQPVTVTVSGSGASSPVTVQVPAGSVVTLGSSSGQASVVLPALQTAAGALAGIQLSTPASGQVQVQVPVHSPNSLPYYSTETPVPTSSGSATTTPGTTASPTGTETTPEATTSPS
jgi:hypothetical protein